MRIGILGGGADALRLLDELVTLEDVQVLGLCDPDPALLSEISSRLAGLDTFDRCEPLLSLQPDVLLILTDNEELQAAARLGAMEGTAIVPHDVIKLWFTTLDAKKPADELARLMDQRLISEVADLLVDISELIRDLSSDLDRTTDALSHLSLNAAIEAAKAGVKGRGFALVADEIFKVSEISDKSIDTARQLMRDLRQRADNLRKMLLE